MLSAKCASLGRLLPLRTSSRGSASTSAASKAPQGGIRQSAPRQLFRPAAGFMRSSPRSHPLNRISHGHSYLFSATSTRHFATESQDKKPADQQQELRSYLKSFLMRVHPDFFSKHPKIQEENDRSLKQLNSLLDMAEEYSNKAAGPILLDRTRVPSRFSATFYLRAGPKTLAETKAEEKKKEREPKADKETELFPPVPGSEFPSIVASYTVPESYFTNPFSREHLERDVRVFLNDLLKQAGLPTLLIEKAANEGRFSADSEVITEQFEDDGSYKPREYVNHRREAHSLRKEFKHVLASFLDRHFPAAQMAADKLGHDWELHVGHKPEALIALGLADLHHTTERERKQIHYQPDLDGEERAQGLLLVEELWNSGIIPNDIPIFVTRDANAFLTPQSLPGFITIPLSFENDTFQQYLKDNLRTIMVSRYNMRGQLLEAEFMIRNFTKTFKLSRIDTMTSLEHAVVALTAINESRETLMKNHKSELEGMAWNIVEAQAIAEHNKSGDPASYMRPRRKNTTTKETQAPKEAETWTVEPKDSGYELEDVPDSALKRRKLDLSPEYLAKMAAIRAKKMEEARKKPFFDDWDEPEDEEIKSAVEDATPESTLASDEIVKEIEQEFRKSKRGTGNSSGEAEQSGKDSEIKSESEEPMDEFEEAIMQEQKKKAEEINRELVYTEGTPVYSLKKDLLLIPWNTSSEALLAWFESNRATLHFRTKIYPSKEWRSKLRLVCKNLRLLLGMSSVAFYGRTIWDKSVQIVALKNLETHAGIIRNAGLKDFKLVMTQNTLGVNFPKRTLRLPYNISPKLWATFLRDLTAESQKPKVAGGKRFIGKTIRL